MCTEKHCKWRMLYIIHLWCNLEGEIFEIVHIVHIVQIVNDTWCTFDGEKHRGNFTIWLGPLRRPLETLLISPLNHHHLFSHYFSPYFSHHFSAKPSSSFLPTKPSTSFYLSTKPSSSFFLPVLTTISLVPMSDTC